MSIQGAGFWVCFQELLSISMPVLIGGCDFCREGDFLQHFDLYQMSYLHQLAVCKLSFALSLVAFSGYYRYGKTVDKF